MSEKKYHIHGVYLDGLKHRSHLVPTNLLKGDPIEFTGTTLPPLTKHITRELRKVDRSSAFPSYSHSAPTFSILKLTDPGDAIGVALLRTKVTESPIHIGITQAGDNDDVFVNHILFDKSWGPSHTTKVHGSYDLFGEYESSLDIDFEIPMKWLTSPSSIKISPELKESFPMMPFEVDPALKPDYTGPILTNRPGVYLTHRRSQTNRINTCGFIEKRSSIETGFSKNEIFRFGIETEFRSQIEPGYYNPEQAIQDHHQNTDSHTHTSDNHPMNTISSPLSPQEIRNYIYNVVDRGTRKFSFIARLNYHPVIAYDRVTTVSHYDAVARLSTGPDFSGISSEVAIGERYHIGTSGFKWSIRGGFIQSFKNLLHYFVYGYHGENYLHLGIDEKYPHVPNHDRFYPEAKNRVRGVKCTDYGPKHHKTLKNVGGDSYFSAFASYFFGQIMKSELQPYIFWNYSVFSSFTHWLHRCFEPSLRRIEYYYHNVSMGVGLVWPSQIGTFEMNYTTTFDQNGDFTPFVASFGASVDW